MALRNDEIAAEYGREIHSSYSDNLTGLYNHGIFQLVLDREIKRFQRYQTPFTLCMVNLDGFQIYNRRHGPLKAELILKETAAIIRQNIRSVDLAARYSGDQFAIISLNTDTEGAEMALERIRNAVETLTGGEVTVSVGMAAMSDIASNCKDDLIHHAETALKTAKIHGKNKIIAYHRKEMRTEEAPAVVLVVDDEPLNRKLLQSLLETIGFNALSAKNGPDALYILNKTEVDLVLLDIMMPGIDGFEVCRRIKAQEATRMIPVILITGLDDTETKIKGIEAGADDFITKPPNRAELIARTRSLVKFKHLTDNLASIENVLFSMAKTVEAKDRYTQGHVERVSATAVALGGRMGLSENDQEALRFGGILHDIGKIGVPMEILNKPGPLSATERQIMQKHPDIGYRICLPLKKNLGAALDIIRHHHEKLDGSGYPDGLKCDEISLPSRILGVADIYDALITDRPYRKALPQLEVFQILREEAKSGKLDPKVVDCLIDLHRSQARTLQNAAEPLSA